MFVVWGVHWLLGFAGHYGRTCMGTHTRTCSGISRPATFTSQCCYPVLLFPERLPLEALGKVLLPVLAMLLELWLAQSAGYRWVESPCSTKPSCLFLHTFTIVLCKASPFALSSPVYTCLLLSCKLLLPSRSLLCPRGAPRAGRFNGDTVNNWQARGYKRG